jgi:hypothetical protein
MNTTPFKVVSFSRGIRNFEAAWTGDNDKKDFHAVIEIRPRSRKRFAWSNVPAWLQNCAAHAAFFPSEAEFERD